METRQSIAWRERAEIVLAADHLSVDNRSIDGRRITVDDISHGRILT
jgi:hypothetical protein